MTSNSRFTVAIHILTLLAFCGPEALTSEFIAGSVNTNPVVVRRLLARLRAARMVASQGGPGGGWRLLREPRELDLGQILAAVEGSALFPLHAATPNPQCPVGRNIQAALAGIFQDAQQALTRNLARTTVAQLAQDLATAAS
jgi:Rrf2 family protein